MISLRINFITTAAKNASESLSMAMQLYNLDYKQRGDIDGIQELVGIINSASVKLRNLCLRNEYRINTRLPDK